MAPLSVEKRRILDFIAQALGETGVYDAPLNLSYPALEHELPGYFSAVESLELHLGIEIDRTQLVPKKRVTADLYLPGRSLYVELDREGHDLTESRLTTLLYYPPGLPRGFRLDEQRELIRVLNSKPGAPGAGKMNHGRALVDFAKDLYVEGVLGKVLVRLPKAELLWLLDRSSAESKLARLARYLEDRADALNLPALRP